ncbi:Anaphase-promoting complex (APC), Cdc23 subunit [Trachipleistophora hominis]|uniref:Anaphase-promoting complex (APC), Cdc23 subunit n=1 Tax=Trachipleistophora hominis TaxID=72359 RepID=L7JVN5_TRAHO|nr:Anaphase-promoting complex (APC), Cdc23 subunit [Trachipleistophora hominis]
MSFYSHAQFNTLSHLEKLSINIPQSLTAQEIPLLVQFHLKNYYMLYQGVHCRPDKQFYFCTCHSTRDNFLRNYALLLHKNTIKESVNVSLEPYVENEFILYVCALLESDRSRKEDLLMNAVTVNGLFVDAWQELMGVLEDRNRIVKIGSAKTGDEKLVWEVVKVELYCRRFIDLGIDENVLFKVGDWRKSEMSTDEHRMGHKSQLIDHETNDSCVTNTNYRVRDDMNHISNEQSVNPPVDTHTRLFSPIISNSVSGCHPDLNTPYLRNLSAAYFYHKKEYDLSLALFNTSTLIDYYDLYSNILYIKNDKRALSLLCHSMHSKYPFSVETMATAGNFYSLQKDHTAAIHHFKRAVRFNHRYAFLNTLIAHEYMELNQYNTAIKYYSLSANDYRAYFGMGQAYAMQSSRLAIAFFKKALLLNSTDPFIWQSLGHEYKKFGDIANALECYRRMVECGEVSGWLMIGDMYKNRKEYKHAVEYYEKYVGVVKDEKISKYLREYHGRLRECKEGGDEDGS